MRIITVWGLAALVSACASGPTQQKIKYPADYERASADIGKTFWVQPDSFLWLSLCEAPREISLDTKCNYAKGKFTVQSVEQPNIKTFYRVTFEDGRSGYIGALEKELQSTNKDPAIAAAECKRRGNPRIGMTHQQVIATCWGEPENVNRTETGNVVFDQYVYSDGRYVYLRNGAVTSLQVSGTLAR